MRSAGRRAAPRRAGQAFVVTLIVLSASVFAFSVAGIAGVGAGSMPAPSVVEAADDAARQAERARGGWWDGDGSYRSARERRPCRDRRDGERESRTRRKYPRFKS
jgi:hypothetical protein